METTSLRYGWLRSSYQSLFAALALSETCGPQAGLDKRTKMADPPHRMESVGCLLLVGSKVCGRAFGHGAIMSCWPRSPVVKAGPKAVLCREHLLLSSYTWQKDRSRCFDRILLGRNVGCALCRRICQPTSAGR